MDPTEKENARLREANLALQKALVADPMDQYTEIAQLRAQLAQAETERDRLHQLVCDARSKIDPEKHAEWDREANAEADRCELYMDTNQQLRAQLGRVETMLTVFECRLIEESPGDAAKLAILLRRALADPKEKP